MRNWNSSSLANSLTYYHVFSLPMRNWNYIEGNTTTEYQNVFSLPMRNWNQFLGTWRSGKLIVFSLPMRNWNGVTVFKKMRQPVVCFQPTYEELKHDTLVSGCNKYNVFSLPMRNWNWGLSSCSSSPSSVFSLPMRNWNILPRKFIFLLLLFSAYLWGIETEHAGHCELVPVLFSAYLWGIETCIERTYGDGINAVFSLPMRNWNYLPGPMEGSGRMVFSLPMRNWNLEGNSN